MYESIPDDVYDEIDDEQVAEGLPSRDPVDPQRRDNTDECELDNIQVAANEPPRRPVDDDIEDQYLTTGFATLATTLSQDVSSPEESHWDDGGYLEVV